MVTTSCLMSVPTRVTIKGGEAINVVNKSVIISCSEVNCCYVTTGQRDTVYALTILLSICSNMTTVKIWTNQVTGNVCACRNTHVGKLCWPLLNEVTYFLANLIIQTFDYSDMQEVLDGQV